MAQKAITKTPASKKVVPSRPAKKAAAPAKKAARPKAAPVRTVATPKAKPAPAKSAKPAPAKAPTRKPLPTKAVPIKTTSPASKARPAATVPTQPVPVPTVVAAKALAKASVAPAALVEAPAPGSGVALLAEGARPRKGGRAASKYFVAQLPTPLPPPTSRFADRFAPPRPPTRQMNNLELDVPKHAQKSDPKLANAWKSKAGKDLTEAELLAMPESEYMNEKQLEFFRAKLQELKDDLLSNAGETTEHLREDTSIVPDPADRATIEEEHALELRTRDRERKLLKKISQSLGRLDSGDYGFCDETGEPIGLGRLIARPTATLSLEAQQRRELKQKMFGD
jgi:DnaK suppressor protein